jgi:hypothetical protein
VNGNRNLLHIISPIVFVIGWLVSTVCFVFIYKPHQKVKYFNKLIASFANDKLILDMHAHVNASLGRELFCLSLHDVVCNLNL